MSRPQQSPSTSSVSTRDFRDPEKELGEDPEKDIPSPASALQDAEKGEVTSNIPADPYDWNGPNDPANPLNWPNWKRYYHVIPPALISFTGYVSFSSRLPSI